MVGPPLRAILAVKAWQVNANPPYSGKFMRRSRQCVFHNEIGPPLIFSGFVYGDDVRMPQSRHALRFGLKSRKVATGDKKGGRTQLQRDPPIEIGLICLVNNTHSAMADILDPAKLRIPILEVREEEGYVVNDPRPLVWTYPALRGIGCQGAGAWRGVRPANSSAIVKGFALSRLRRLLDKPSVPVLRR